MIPSAMYLLCGVLTVIASRKNLFRPGVLGFFETAFIFCCWPLWVSVRVLIFLVEGNLWNHLED